MSKRRKLTVQWMSILALALMIAAAFAQNPAQTPRPTPPDQKAFTEANGIREPEKKIEALDKFIADFPESNMVASAHLSIFSVLVKSHPDQSAKILERAGKVIEKNSAALNRINAYNAMASQLVDANIMISEAESFASRGTELLNEEAARIAANPPAQPAAAKGNAPARPAINPMAGVERAKAGIRLTLGRIYLKQGKLDAAETQFKESLTMTPAPMAATLGMAEVYEKRGDVEKALSAYLSAAATGKMMPAQRQSLNALYAKTHKGSLAGLEEALDAKYTEANPAPFTVEHYKPSAGRSDKVVLTEVFTGSGCPPCVAADLAADISMERYSQKELVVVMYHQHIPQPDPMTTPQTSARFKYYAGSGVPTMVIDGVTSPGGGGARDATRRVYDRISPEIEKNLDKPARARLTLSGALKGSTVKANVTVDQIAQESPDLKLHILLVEEKLRYTGENGVRFHPMVVRSMAGAEGTGIRLNAKQLSWDFDIPAISAGIRKHLDEYEAGGHRGNTFTFAEKKYEINPKDLVLVAFIQDEKTKAILQTAIVKVK